jgi:Flp pilus assembly protein TadD
MNSAAADQGTGVEELVGRVADEFTERVQRGERPDVEEYARRHPQLAEVMRQVLPALQALAPEPDSAAPRDLGDYRLIREVGRGGMGIVYEAEQVSLGRRVALKVLPFAATMDPRHLQRFHNEARAAAGLHHANIVPVYGVGNERGVHYYAMQFIEGRTLADLIAEQRGAALSQVPTMTQTEAGPAATTAPPAAQATSTAPRDAAYFRRVAEWGIQAAEALDHAHQLGIVHRDVKPANLLVDGRGGLWVTDFGLAQVQSEARLTMTGDLLGTLRYMSPEQALAQRVVIDHRTDVYSLGATLYELLTLRPAFEGNDRQELLRQIAQEEPKTPHRVNRTIPAELETIVLKAMEKRPQERYATAQELATDLERYLRDEPIRARRPGLGRRARKWARRYRAAVTAAAVCLVVTFAALLGSVGWVLSDRAARRRDAESKVREALEAAAPGLRQGNPRDPTLTTAVQRAEAQLSGGTIGAALRQRVEQLQKDVQMLLQLERIRLDQTWTLDEDFFNRTASDAEYARAFRTYGIDVAAMSPQEAAALVQGSAIREHLVAGLDDWADCLAGAGKEGAGQQARHLLAVSRQVDPDPWRNRLRDLVLSRDAGDLEQLARSAPVEELSPAALRLLAHAVAATAWPSAPMLAALGRAQRRFPGDFWLNSDLARALLGAGQGGRGIGFCRAAVALRPRSPAAHLNLGLLLWSDADEAVGEFREAIRLKNDYAMAHFYLGALLGNEKRDEDGAIAEYRTAIACDPNCARAHNNLGLALLSRKDVDGAIAECRTAVTCNPGDSNTPRQSLFMALLAKGELDAAAAECRELIRRKSDATQYHNQLRHVLRLAEVEAKLPQVLTGEVQPIDNAERMELAESCQWPRKALYAASARFYADAFSRPPGVKGADDPRSGLRYNAACAAALAGCGQGMDADQCDDPERARLRRQALEWLRADLAAYRGLLEKEPDKAGPGMRQAMQLWQEDKDFAGVRAPEALAELPEAEREGWEQLWAVVADTLARAEGKAAAEKKSAPK